MEGASGGLGEERRDVLVTWFEEDVHTKMGNVVKEVN